ncbi:MAG: transglutaminase-like domain-containing protein [Verrucomicrobiota bacterium]
MKVHLCSNVVIFGVLSLWGWLLTASWLPLILGIAVGLVAFLLRPSQKAIGRAAIFALTAAVTTIATLWQSSLYKSGFATAIGAQPDALFHLAFAASWFGISIALSLPETFEKDDPIGRGIGWALLAIASLAALGSTLQIDLYDFPASVIYPVAALPLATLLVISLYLSRQRFKLRTLGVGLALTVFGSAFGVSLLEGAKRAETLLLEFRYSDKTAFAGESLSRSRSSDPDSPFSDGSSRTLPRELDLDFEGRVEVWMQAESEDLFQQWLEQPFYVRTSTVATFESDEVLSPIRSGRWQFDADDSVADGRVTIEGPIEALAPRYQVLASRASAIALPLIPGTDSIFAEAVYEYGDDWHQLAPFAGIDQFRFSASAARQIELLSPTSNRRFGSRATSLAYLNFPPSPLRLRITDLVRDWKEAPPLEMIQQFLRDETRYETRFSIPNDRSPLESFLFAERQGHCEYYAAATVLLLRHFGIPSRLAYGYVGGVTDREQRLVGLRDSDSHAWAEILTAEGSWAIFDTSPRPPEALSLSQENTLGSALNEDEFFNLSDLAIDPIERRSRIVSFLENALALLINNPWPLLFVLLGATGLLVWFRGRRSQKDESSLIDLPSISRNRSNTRLAMELRKFAEQRGIDISVGSTWLELASHFQPTPPSVRDAVDYLNATRYAGAPLDSDLERRLMAGLKSEQQQNAPALLQS